MQYKFPLSAEAVEQLSKDKQTNPLMDIGTLRHEFQICAYEDTLIYTVGPGRVIFSQSPTLEDKTGHWRNVIIALPHAVYVTYTHIDPLVALLDKVTPGQIVGRQYRLGNAPYQHFHLHFFKNTSNGAAPHAVRLTL